MTSLYQRLHICQRLPGCRDFHCTAITAAKGEKFGMYSTIIFRTGTNMHQQVDVQRDTGKIKRPTKFKKIRNLLLENLRGSLSRGTNYHMLTVSLFEIAHHFPNSQAHQVAVLEERNIHVGVANHCNPGGIMEKEGQPFEVMSAESIQDEPEIRNYPGVRINRYDHGRFVEEEVLVMRILARPELRLHPGRGTNNRSPGGIVAKEGQLVEVLLAVSIQNEVEIRESGGTMNRDNHGGIMQERTHSFKLPSTTNVQTGPELRLHPGGKTNNPHPGGIMMGEGRPSKILSMEDTQDALDLQHHPTDGITHGRLKGRWNLWHHIPNSSYTTSSTTHPTASPLQHHRQQPRENQKPLRRTIHYPNLSLHLPYSQA